MRPGRSVTPSCTYTAHDTATGPPPEWKVPWYEARTTHARRAVPEEPAREDCLASSGGVVGDEAARGAGAYVPTAVARSLDEYYTGEGEAGRVVGGAGTAGLGLDGALRGEDVRAVLAPTSGGLTPNGEELRRTSSGCRARLTFKAPKSLSMLYAVSDDPRVQGAVVEQGSTYRAAGSRPLHGNRPNRARRRQAHDRPLRQATAYLTCP